MLLYTFNAGNFYWVDNHDYLHFPLISISTFFAVKEAMSFFVFQHDYVFFFHLVCLIFSFFCVGFWFWFCSVLFYVLTLFSARLLCNVLLT